MFRIRFNNELYELLNDIDVVQRINIQLLHWLDLIVRMKEELGRVGYLEIGKEHDIVSIERTKSRKLYHRLLCEGRVSEGRSPLIELL